MGGNRTQPAARCDGGDLHLTTEAELAPKTYCAQNEWKGCVVPYGTLEPTGDRNLQVERFYAACPEVRERPFILFIGRLHKKKGCDLLIQAFARAAAGRSGSTW